MVVAKHAFTSIFLLLFVLCVLADDVEESLQRIHRGTVTCLIGSGSAKWSNGIYFKDHLSNYLIIPTNETILELSSWKSPLIFGISFGIVYHEFIIMRTNKAYWSVEKACEGITLARGDFSDVFEVYRNEKREGKTEQTRPWRNAKPGSTIARLVNWLKVGETIRGYNFFGDNCQHLVKRVYAHFSA